MITLTLLKQLKVSAIVLQSARRLFDNFKFSRIYFRDIIVISFFFLIIASLLLDITFQKLFYLSLLVLIFDLIILNTVGYNRKKEIEEIKSVIKSIRKNKIKSSGDIKLSKSLSDIESNLKAMLKRTQNDMNNMEKLAQARSDFLGYVSHELRTPIFTIQGYLETLLSGAINDDKVNVAFLEKAYKHSENLNSLLNDLIDISMIESGQMSLSFRFFNLKNFLNEIISEHQKSAEEKNNKIIVPDFNSEIEIYGDKEKLKQVFNNLLSNAIKYTSEGVIKIIVVEKTKTILFKIIDDGMGIKHDEIEKVFQRFYRTKIVREKSLPGTGLGLAIVKHIIEAHNSRITVKSEFGIGTEFSFSLKK